MPDGRFRWHSDAHVFAGSEPVRPEKAAVCPAIPAEPIGAAVTGLHAAITQSSGFCVSNGPPPDLDKLDDGTFVTLTGGTSGRPKAVLRSHASWMRSFEANAALFDYNAQDSIAMLGTLSHSLALYGLLEAIHLGLRAHVLSSLSPSEQSTQLREHGCTILYATPTQLRLLPKDRPLPDIRLVLCGGGALGADTRSHLGTIFPNADLHVFYGAAETSFVTLGGPDTPHGSVGRAYPQVDIEVRDPDRTGTGTIWVRSPYLFEGYLNGDTPHTRRDGDWLTVGELGHLDSAGNLFLRGRAGRVFTVADQTIYPEELEARILALQEVPQCAVLARLDTLRGRHLIAVVAGPEREGLRARIADHCAQNGLHRPREVLFLDPFPLLPSGKPDLQRIAALTGAVL